MEWDTGAGTLHDGVVSKLPGGVGSQVWPNVRLCCGPLRTAQFAAIALLNWDSTALGLHHAALWSGLAAPPSLLKCSRVHPRRCEGTKNPGGTDTACQRGVATPARTRTRGIPAPC